MKLAINGIEYDLSPEDEAKLFLVIQGKFLASYDSLDSTMRIMLKPVTRAILAKLEEGTRAKFGDDAALRIRPARHADPTKHLASVTLALARQGLQDAIISIETSDEYHTVTALTTTTTHQGEGGRQMATNGDIGMWKNDISQISGRGVHETVSDDAPLHP